MFTEEEIDDVGTMLEDKGLSHSEIDAYFEHAGVKGMKWGQRRTKKAQGRVDKIKIVASGNATRREGANAGYRYLRKEKQQRSAQKTLISWKKTQTKVNSGKSKVSDILLKAGGINIRELNLD